MKTIEKLNGNKTYICLIAYAVLKFLLAKQWIDGPTYDALAAPLLPLTGMALKHSWDKKAAGTSK